MAPAAGFMAPALILNYKMHIINIFKHNLIYH